MVKRFEKAEQTGREILHADLIKEVHLILADDRFGTNPDKKSRMPKNLFDQSTAMTTMRGNKYAKDLEGKLSKN